MFIQNQFAGRSYKRTTCRKGLLKNNVQERFIREQSTENKRMKGLNRAC